MRTRQQPPFLTNDDGETIPLPYVFEICSACSGHGKSSAYLGAFTRSDMDEAGPDFMEAYMAGEYDRVCDDCDGTGKVMVADTSRMTPAQVKQLEDEAEDERSWRAEAEAERRMGC